MPINRTVSSKWNQRVTVLSLYFCINGGGGGGVRLHYYKTKDLTSPNLIIPFDYLLILAVEHADIVCPTTFIAKGLKFRGTSVTLSWRIVPPRVLLVQVLEFPPHGGLLSYNRGRNTVALRVYVTI